LGILPLDKTLAIAYTDSVKVQNKQTQFADGVAGEAGLHPLHGFTPAPVRVEEKTMSRKNNFRSSEQKLWDSISKENHHPVILEADGRRHSEDCSCASCECDQAEQDERAFDDLYDEY